MRHCCIGRWLVSAATMALVTVLAIHAQEPTPPPKSAFVGGWTLNKDLSPTAPSIDPPEGRRRGGFGDPGGAPPGGGGFGGGMGGGGFGRGGMGGGGRSEGDRQQMQQALAVMRELMTPTAHWVITSTDGEVFTFTDAEGRSTKYAASNKPEKHQLVGATIETRTTWDRGRLRQELSLPGGMKVQRVLAIEGGEVQQLIVTITPQGGPGGRDGRRPAPRFVYDRDMPDER